MHPSRSRQTCARRRGAPSLRIDAGRVWYLEGSFCAWRSLLAYAGGSAIGLSGAGVLLLGPATSVILRLIDDISARK